MKLPFLRALRAAFPQAWITWLAGRGDTVFASTLASVVVGLADEVIEQGGVTGREWLPTRAAPMPGREFDLIIDTQRHVRTTLSLRRIEHRVFVSGALGWLLSDRRPPGRRRKQLALIHQLLALVEAASGRPAAFDAAPLAIDAATRAEALRLLPDRADGRAYLGIAPGAAMQHKLWPLDRFLEIGKRLDAAGYVPVVLLGPMEQDWTTKIRETLPQAILPLPADASPLTTIAVCGRLKAAVANDSGQGHLLAAASVPLISLFGPTQAAKFPPMTPRLTVIRAQDFGSDAMSAIPVEPVEKAVLEMLRGA